MTRLTDDQLQSRLRADQECIRLLELRLAKSAIPEDAWDHARELADFQLRVSLITELMELRKALIEIAEQDYINLALDPQWPQRIAESALNPKAPK